MQAVETSSTVYFYIAKKEKKKILKKNNLSVLNRDFLQSLAHYLPQ